MTYCHKCGSEIKEENSFCLQCGADLKAGEPRASMSHMPPKRYRSEKTEKQEKTEKNEKEEKMEKGGQQEKYEKQEFVILGPLIGGVILIIVGFILYLTVSGVINLRSLFPVFLIIIGAIVIFGVIIGVIIAKGKNPRP